MSLNRLRKLIKKNMAMDLGTANTLIYVEGEGIVLNEPTVIVLSDEGEVITTGEPAKRYIGRTPGKMRAIHPMKDGVIEDFDAITHLIRSFLHRTREARSFLTPRIVICVPSHITQVEKKAVLDAATEAGAKKIHLLEETMAAAIGADLPIHGERPKMVVDIGGGTTEIAVIAQWAFLYSNAIRVAGDELNEAVSSWLLEKYGLEVGAGQAELIKWEAGSAWDFEGDSVPYVIAGKDRGKGGPGTVKVPPSDLRKAFMEPLMAICKAINDVLDNISEEVRRAVKEDGITVTGGGALLRGLDRFLSHATGVQCKLSSTPLTTVVLGAGKAVEEFKLYKKVFIN